MVQGPIAFKAEDDGTTVARHHNGKACNILSKFANSQPILDNERSCDHSQTWRDMEALVATGAVRSIGIEPPIYLFIKTRGLQFQQVTIAKAS